MIDIDIHGNPLSFDESLTGLLKKVVEECQRTGRMSCLVRAMFERTGMEVRFRVSVIDTTMRAAPLDGPRKDAA